MSEDIPSKETIMANLEAIAKEQTLKLEYGKINEQANEHIHELYKAMVPDDYIAILRMQIKEARLERDLFRAEAMAAREMIDAMRRGYGTSPVNLGLAMARSEAYDSARKRTDEMLKGENK